MNCSKFNEKYGEEGAALRLQKVSDEKPWTQFTKEECQEHIMEYVNEPKPRCEGCSLLSMALRLLCILDGKSRLVAETAYYLHRCAHDDECPCHDINSTAN